MATNHERPMAKRPIYLAAVLVLACSLMPGGRSLLAQTLATPGDMPIIYREIPGNGLAKKRARHRVKLTGCTLAYQGVKGGYTLIKGGQEFVILNQNPACLKRFAGKTLTITGKTTESVVPWFNLYFLVIDKINGMQYSGKVGPWVMREPTDEEIRFWNLHKRLPPATQNFMAYLDLPGQANWASWNGTPAPDELNAEPGALYAQNHRSGPAAEVEPRLADLQRQLRALEKRVTRQPYNGIYSKPTEEWNSTDWSLYMDSQGGG